jgi:hypothetical protein
MNVQTIAPALWPELPLNAWKDTYATLHMWTQVVGKVRLALSPRLNHWWEVPLYVTSLGLTTSPIPYGNEIFEIHFDFIHHKLVIRTSKDAEKVMALAPRSVADFFKEFMKCLGALDIHVKFWKMPCEVPDPIAFDKDTKHASYHPEYANRFWRILVLTDEIFKEFRSHFIGKSSPVHFFWGSFDLAVTRFSGRRAPLHPGGVPYLPDRVTREAYSHEVSSAGFWPGNEAFPQASFYSYAYPEPAGFRGRSVTHGAHFDATLGEFILPYDTVRGAANPDALLLDFLSTTYAAAAEAGGWNRAALECPIGVPGRVRQG